ncbi:MAG: hypothetical protein WA633_02405 [Stellaceae bacterium]
MGEFARDNPELRRAIMLAFDRKAFIDIIGEGQDEIGATLQPPPNGVWGMPADILRTFEVRRDSKCSHVHVGPCYVVSDRLASSAFPVPN